MISLLEDIKLLINAKHAKNKKDFSKALPQFIYLFQHHKITKRLPFKSVYKIFKILIVCNGDVSFVKKMKVI